MRLRASYFLWSIATLLVFFSGGLWFISNFERVEETFRTGAEEEARRNPFLAAERFLNQNGIQTEHTGISEFLTVPPSSNDTILLSSRQNSRLLTDKRQQILHDWLEAGGHLIAISHSYWNEKTNSSGDPFLDDFGIQKYRQTLSTDELKELTPVETNFDDEDETLTTEFTANSYLVDSDEAAFTGIGTKNGFYLLQLHVGDGMLTVINDDHLWHNAKIGDHDHAFFLQRLIGNKSDSAKVWIVRDLDFPSLLSLAWGKAPYAMLTLGLLVIVSLWAAYNRFGPALIFNHRIRRSLIEHLDACGRYHWQQNQAGELLITLREQLHQLLETRQPNWRRLTQQQQLRWLSQRCNRSEAALSIALTAAPQTEKEFTRIIQLLQHLRKTL